MRNKNFIYMVIFAIIVIVIAEMIGAKFIPIGQIKVALLPLAFALLICMILGLQIFRKGILTKIYSKENVEFAGKYLIIIMLPLMARYGADIAPKIKEILSIGFVFMSQEIGNLGTVVLGLPVAIFLGLRREAIGATLGIGREGELAYITEKYTLNSPEGEGVLGMYIFGTLFGALFFSIVAPLFEGIGLRPEALAMASGMGSASMMAAASSALSVANPQMEETIRAYAATSQLLTSFFGTFTMVLLAAPLQKIMYKKLTRGDK